MVIVFLILSCVQAGSGSAEETYLKRNAGSWAQDLSHGDAKTRRAAAYALGKLGKHALPYLAQLKTVVMQDGDVSVRSTSASTLGNLAPIASQEIVAIAHQAFMQEKQSSVRQVLALALGRAGEAAGAAEPALRKALDEPEAILRQNATWALGQLGKAAEPALPRLMKAVSDPEAGVRAEAAQALGNLGPLAEEAVPVLIRALDDADPHVQEQSVLALRRIGPQAAVAISSLLTVAESSKAEVHLREAALITIESTWPTGLKESASWERLQALAGSASDAKVKEAARRAVQKIGPLRK